LPRCPAGAATRSALRVLLVIAVIISSSSIAGPPAHAAGISAARDCAGGCSLRPEPVCGSDGHTYANDCIAECQGVALSRAGPCQDGEALLRLQRRIKGRGAACFAGPQIAQRLPLPGCQLSAQPIPSNSSTDAGAAAGLFHTLPFVSKPSAGAQSSAFVKEESAAEPTATQDVLQLFSAEKYNYVGRVRTPAGPGQAPRRRAGGAAASRCAGPWPRKLPAPAGALPARLRWP
jgi:hypothetical protein